MNATGKTPVITRGMRIPYMKDGTVMGPRKGNLLIAVANAILNLKFVAGAANDFVLSAQNAVATISNVPGNSSTSTGGFAWNSTKEFDLAFGAYLPNDVVTVSPDNPATMEYGQLSGGASAGGVIDPDAGFRVWARPGQYVCLKATDGTHIPQWPAPSPNAIDDALNYWWPISGLKLFRGTWAISVFPDAATELGVNNFGLRFADGDVVLFNYQQNTPGTQQFQVPFYHIGNTLNETVYPVTADLKGSYNETYYTQVKWRCAGFSWLCNASPLNLATIVPGAR